MSGMEWRKPGRCDTGNCIEVKRGVVGPDAIWIRIGGFVNRATPAEFAAWVKAAKDGEYDDLVEGT